MKIADLSISLVLTVCSLTLAGCGGGGGGLAQRSLVYSNAVAYESGEYQAQAGLGQVNASDMYFNGHYRWYAQNGGTGGSPGSSNAGTGVGITVGVADSGITAAEAGTSSSIVIDNVVSYDYVNNTSGSGADQRGHGTHVAGIIAAPRNDSGMHGLAYNASIANFRIINSAGSVIATDAQISEMFDRARTNGVMIMNNSWGSSLTITSVTAGQINATIPNSVSALQRYVAAGGVVVFAAGNDGYTQSSYQAGLPYRISGIENGWLAVIAVDPNGNETMYTNRCGVAANWCLAAPGGGDNQNLEGIYSTYNDGTYRRLSGTSMAAPHVSGAIAALKSMFPNLSYHQVRDRLLLTANKTGIYSNSLIYGQGLMDLAAASSPVGGLSIPISNHANGSIANGQSQIQLPSSLVNSINLQSHVMLLDNYQRAPFWVSTDFLIGKPTRRASLENHMKVLSGGDVTTTKTDRITAFSSQSQFSTMAVSIEDVKLGFSVGSGDSKLDKATSLNWTPTLHLTNSPSTSTAFSQPIGKGRLGVMLTGKSINNGIGSISTNDGFDYGKRNSFSVMGQYPIDEKSSLGISMSFAKDLENPLGINSSGAFAMNSAKMAIFGVNYDRKLSENLNFRFLYESGSTGGLHSHLLDIEKAKSNLVTVSISSKINEKDAVDFGFSRSKITSSGGDIRLPTSINENGDVTYNNYNFSGIQISSKFSFDMKYKHSISKSTTLHGSLFVNGSGELNRNSQIIIGLRKSY
jgi:hypothetical protein